MNGFRASGRRALLPGSCGDFAQRRRSSKYHRPRRWRHNAHDRAALRPAPDALARRRRRSKHARGPLPTRRPSRASTGSSTAGGTPSTRCTGPAPASTSTRSSPASIPIRPPARRDDYYLISSTFAYFPGIPIFRSRDLVNWTQIGNVIHRPEQLKFDSLGMSRGVFAPTINYHAGTFYVLNTCVDCGGNFLVTATNPAGPWSDPVWIPEVGGIDPSIFFDDDGKAYVINNDEPTGGSTLPGAPRDLDPRVRSGHQEGERSSNADHQRRRGHHAEADLDRGAAHLQDRRQVLPELRRRRDGRRPPAGDLPQRQRPRALGARARADQPDPHAAPPRLDAAVPRDFGGTRRLPADAERRVVGDLPRHAAVRRRLLQHRGARPS